VLADAGRLDSDTRRANAAIGDAVQPYLRTERPARPDLDEAMRAADWLAHRD
jgi:hypothetical protein